MTNLKSKLLFQEITVLEQGLGIIHQFHELVFLPLIPIYTVNFEIAMIRC